MLLRPESEEDRARLLEALEHMADVSPVNATIAKEGVEIACAGSLPFCSEADQRLLSLTTDGVATQH
ncbi:hypothetical protein PPMP20_29320 [Paraburkholderia phymatum]|uniref:hypothetical protein n=1 Tax=Paraburkholderia phymatum TaxID=148447 RepID=UPI0002F6CC28|nr:hypothetical protein [Paraburkholderia phymatum]